MKKTISIIGLGKLGASMAAVYASKGSAVIGVDINPKIVATINKGLSPVVEPGLSELIKTNQSRIRATTNTPKAVAESEIVFIIVPTPSLKNGYFSLVYIKKACQAIGKALAKKDSYTLVVLTSTILPGDSLERIIPILEKTSGKKCGQDFGFCYNPEFIAIGNVIKDLKKPDFFLVGQYDNRSGELLEEFLRKISGPKVAVVRMNLPSAELTKISLNAYVTTKISFANNLAQIAQTIAGINVDEVTAALGMDHRIGPAYLKGGFGFGGPCFPRDNIAFSKMAGRKNVTAPLALSTHRYNEQLAKHIAKNIISHVPQEAIIGVLGLAYKSDTPVTEESHSIKLIKTFLKENFDVSVYDPLAYEFAKTELKDTVYYCRNLKECVSKSDVLIPANLDRNFRNLPQLLPVRKPKILIDPWRQFFHVRFTPNIKYIPLGVGPALSYHH